LLDKIEFLISESLKTFRRNGLMTFAAVSTVAVALFLMGGLAYTYYQLSSYAARNFPKQFTMKVFMKEGTSYEELKRTAIELRSIPGVVSAALIPKERAYPKFVKEMNLPGLDEEEHVPIQDSFIVGLQDLSEDTATAVSSQIMALPNVDTRAGVKYLASEQRFVEQLLGLLRLFGPYPQRNPPHYFVKKA
jgi:cell division protein FtsX